MYSEKPFVAAPRTSPPRESDRPTYDSRDLFGERLQIVIAHGEERYVLRRTRQGKLILTK